VVTTFGATYVIVACIFPWIPPWVPLLPALLAWILQRFLNGGKDRGDADPVDVEWDDADNFGEDGQSLDGDLVAIHGPWVMDTEHAQYFEIHPVKAFYVLGRDASGNIEIFDSPPIHPLTGTNKLYNGDLNADMVNNICAHVNQAENKDPDPVKPSDPSTVLSYGLTTNHGGGGFPPQPPPMPIP
ncbi:MAG: hypothetical protein OEY89_15545, partial [Gammaproteobacteria bacterium]|nr:hypothetical protein [Gammaproteobacteria bacterium]